MQSWRIMHCGCIGFMMKILLLHWRKMRIDIQIGSNLVNVCLKCCIIIWEKQEFSCHMHVLIVEDTVCKMRRMCWTSCTPSMCDLYKVPSQETNISISNSCDGCCTRLWAPFNLYAMCCGLTRQYLPKGMYTICPTCMYEQWRILKLLITVQSSKHLVSTFEPES
jgi:hypothetical protein